jgi:hypothetical protein
VQQKQKKKNLCLPLAQDFHIHLKIVNASAVVSITSLKDSASLFSDVTEVPTNCVH